MSHGFVLLVNSIVVDALLFSGLAAALGSQSIGTDRNDVIMGGGDRKRSATMLACIQVLFLLALLPSAAYTQSTRDVVISEIAWMGTTTSSTDEWIELYNNTGSAIDLTNWTLAAADGTPTITLAGTIPAGGHFLLGRTDDTT